MLKGKKEGEMPKLDSELEREKDSLQRIEQQLDALVPLELKEAKANLRNTQPAEIKNPETQTQPALESRDVLLEEKAEVEGAIENLKKSIKSRFDGAPKLQAELADYERHYRQITRKLERLEEQEGEQEPENNQSGEREKQTTSDPTKVRTEVIDDLVQMALEGEFGTSVVEMTQEGEEGQILKEVTSLLEQGSKQQALDAAIDTAIRQGKLEENSNLDKGALEKLSKVKLTGKDVKLNVPSEVMKAMEDIEDEQEFSFLDGWMLKMLAYIACMMDEALREDLEKFKFSFTEIVKGATLLVRSTGNDINSIPLLTQAAEEVSKLEQKNG